MQRRAFIGVLTGGFLTAPLAAEAQQVGKVYRVGLIFAASDPTSLAVRVLRDALRDLGYVDGQNLVLERRNHGSGAWGS